MKSPFVRELKPDEISTAVFSLVSTKEVRQKRTGEQYLSLVLSDRSGEIDSKMWDNVGEIIETFERDDFVKVKGLMQLYNNWPQFTIHKLRRWSERSRFPGFFSSFPAGSGGDVKEPGEAVKYRKRTHSRASECVSGRHGSGVAVPGRARGQEHSPRIPERAAGARAFAAEAGEAGGKSLRWA